MQRYSEITTKMPREFLLLQGTGCRYKKCSFCDYHTDVSADPYRINRDVLQNVTGRFGVLDIINSGSAPELDGKTIELIKTVVSEKNIHTLWFEAHWMYRNELDEFAKQFNCAVKFRCGAETFDGKMRRKWHKGIPASVTAEDIAKYFKGVCLLIGVSGQTQTEITNNIALAQKYFEYFSVNAFVENSTPLKRDNKLVKWFEQEIMPSLKDDNRAEVLLNNTDLGVG